MIDDEALIRIIYEAAKAAGLHPHPILAETETGMRHGVIIQDGRRAWVVTVQEHPLEHIHD